MMNTLEKFEAKQLADRAVFLDRVTQVNTRVDEIAVATPGFHTLEDSGLVEVRNQSQCTALSNADTIGNLAQRRTWRLGETDEHVCVIAEKSPMR